MIAGALFQVAQVARARGLRSRSTGPEEPWQWSRPGRGRLPCYGGGALSRRRCCGVVAGEPEPGLLSGARSGVVVVPGWRFTLRDLRDQKSLAAVVAVYLGAPMYYWLFYRFSAHGLSKSKLFCAGFLGALSRRRGSSRDVCTLSLNRRSRLILHSKATVLPRGITGYYGLLQRGPGPNTGPGRWRPRGRGHGA